MSRLLPASGDAYRSIALSALCAGLQVRLLQMASAQLEQNFRFGMTLAWDWQGWHGDRSRLLGVGLTDLLGGDLHAYLTAIFISLFIGGFLSWRLAGMVGLMIYHLSFAFLASPWFQPWDIFQATIFTAFLILIVEKKNASWFCILFAIAIFDRPSALFIPLWMVFSGRMIRTGILCVAAGVFLIWYFEHSGQPKLGFYVFQCADRISTGYGNDYVQERLVENLHNSISILIGSIEVSIVIAAGAVIKQETALALTFLTMLVATLVFGVVTETRVYLPFIPLFILASRPS